MFSVQRTYLAWLRTSLSLASIGIGAAAARVGVGAQLTLSCTDSYHSALPTQRWGQIGRASCRERVS